MRNHEHWWPLHLAVLTAFAVSQPLYDLLGKAPEFFVAHRAGPSVIVAFVLVLTIAVPGLLLAVSAAASPLGRTPYRVVQGLLVAVLVTCVFLPIVDRLENLPASAVIAMSGAVGVVSALMFLHFATARIFVTALSPAVVVFPMLFMFGSPVRALLLPARSNTPVPVALTASVPVVLVVFDQLSTPVLLDSRGVIDAVRFPNFAALANESTWFRRASAAHPHTGLALPAILTGQHPQAGRVPVLAQHPDNLFTWLGSSYRLHVSEPMTALCPPSLCESEGEAERFVFRPATFMADLAIVYLHVLVPDEYASAILPPLDGAWRDFRPNMVESENPTDTARTWDGDDAFAEGVGAGRHVQVEQFVAKIRGSEKRTLHFLHVLLPHHPYQYSASGRFNSPGWGPEGLRPDGDWEKSAQLVLTAYHQYVQQVGFVDRLLGSIISELKASDIYDESVVVVTSDHGVAFVPGEPSRTPTAVTYSEVLSVPMFVKRPGQREGRVSERVVSTLDVVPTIGDALGAQVPWRVDGASMLAEAWEERTSISIHGLGGKPLEFDPSALGEPTIDPMRREGLTAGTPLEHAAVKGPHADLIGRGLLELPLAAAASGMQLTVGTLPQFEHVDLNSRLVPALVHGHLRLPRSHQGNLLQLAVALNGRVRTTTEALERSPGLASFAVLLPEAAFQQGDNDLQFFLIDDASGVRRLLRLMAPNVRRIVRDRRGEWLLAAGGQSIAIQPDAVWGWVDGIRHNPWMMRFGGWAADMKAGVPAGAILVFAADQLIAAGAPTFNRDDLPAALGKEGTRGSGFEIEVPRDNLDGKYMSIRVFGLSVDGTVASQIKVSAAGQEALNSISR